MGLFLPYRIVLGLFYCCPILLAENNILFMNMMFSLHDTSVPCVIVPHSHYSWFFMPGCCTPYSSVHACLIRKDLGHFPYKSAQGKGISQACEITAHILTLHYYIRLSWVGPFISDPEPSGWARFSIQVNGAIFKLKNSYSSHIWRAFLFIWRDLYLPKDLIQFDCWARHLWDNSAL